VPVVDSSNPANTAADTREARARVSALELLVVVDVAMTETAAARALRPACLKSIRED